MDYTSPEGHKNSIIQRFIKEFSTKYDQGQKEHGGKLWRKNSFPFLKEEAIDFISYVYSIEDQKDLALDYLTDALDLMKDGPARDCVVSAINILTVGNPKGEEEQENC